MSLTARVSSPAKAPLAGAKAMFLVWGPPSYGPRSRVFARELGIDVRFVRSSDRRGIAVAPFKYASQAVKTAALLLRRRPRIVFVQSPPTPAVFLVLLYSRLTGGRFVVDAHSDAMLSPYWTRPRWLYRAVARRALATIVTNEHFAGTIRRAGGTALVVRDVPTTFATDGRFEVEEGFTVLVVSSFAPDEPVVEVIDAVGTLEGTVAYVTGDPRRADAPLVETAPDNVRFTGFLPNDRYYGLMGAVDVVVCLTTRNHTMQRGACEALWMGRPILTSDWPLLREYFSKGAVHVLPTTAAIRAGLEELRRNHSMYAEQIEQLRVERRREWEEALGSLIALIDPMQSPGHGRVGTS